jgi:hypothetical protein
MLKNLCQTFVTRAENLGLKGKQREAALIEFMCGAYAVLHATKHPEAEKVGVVLSMVFVVRGFSECLRIATAPSPTSQD